MLVTLCRKMGEIAHLLKTAEKTGSPLQKKLARLGLWLGVGSLIAAIVVFVLGVVLGMPDSYRLS